MNYEKLRKRLYAAFLATIEETGDLYKKLSWFGKNKKKPDRHVDPVELIKLKYKDKN